MFRPRLRIFVCLLAWSLMATAAIAQQHFPGKSWQRVDKPEDLGWSTEGLQKAREFSQSLNTSAVVVVVDGRVLDEWGAVSERFNVHSIRKSFLSALYGLAVDAGQIELDKTLAELKIDDREPVLSETEKRATVHDLLKARSGIYHYAAYETEAMREKRPKRGSHDPGTFWYYNNWDFNALGTIYAAKTGHSVFEGFQKHIAEPIGMEDFRLDDTKFVYDDVSDHPAYTFRMTARDMARFGLLFLRQGKWGDQQVIPSSWVEESTRSYSDAGAAGGYGYMWWVADGGKHLPKVDLGEGAYSARGFGGHYILVIPEHDMVIVHRVNTDIKNNRVERDDFSKLVKLILDAKQDK